MTGSHPITIPANSTPRTTSGIRSCQSGGRRGRAGLVNKEVVKGRKVTVEEPRGETQVKPFPTALIMILLSLNIAGASSPLKINLFLALFRDYGADVVCLQETTEGIFWPDSLYRPFANCGGSRAGTTILVKKGIPVSNVRFHASGRITSLTIYGEINIINIYAPPGERNRVERETFYSETVLPYVSSFTGKAILIGDFNAIYRREDSESNNQKILYRPSRALSFLIDALCATDAVLRSALGPAPFTRVGPNSRTRIDFIFLSRLLKQIPYTTCTIPVSLSDHCALLLDLSLPSTLHSHRPATTMWRMDTRPFQDEDFCCAVRRRVADLISTLRPGTDALTWWEITFKPKIKSFIRRSTYEWRRNMDATILFYRNALRELLNLSPRPEKFYEETALLKNTILMHEMKRYAPSRWQRELNPDTWGPFTLSELRKVIRLRKDMSTTLPPVKCT